MGKGIKQRGLKCCGKRCFWDANIVFNTVYIWNIIPYLFLAHNPKSKTFYQPYYLDPPPHFTSPSKRQESQHHHHPLILKSLPLSWHQIHKMILRRRPHQKNPMSSSLSISILTLLLFCLAQRAVIFVNADGSYSHTIPYGQEECLLIRVPKDQPHIIRWDCFRVCVLWGWVI